MNEPTQLPEMQDGVRAEAVAALSKAENDPIVPPKMTRKVWKEMMRIHFTVRRPIVKSCGHKINITSDPRNNCPDCWFAYFSNNKPMTEIADDCFRNAGRDILERSRGKKFTRMFLRFMATVVRFQKESEEKKTNEENVDSGRSDANRSGDVEPTTSTDIGGLAGEAQTIGGIAAEGDSNDYVAEDPINEGPTEGLGTGINGL